MTITAEPESTVTADELAPIGPGHRAQNVACPPWCEIEDHDDHDGGKMRHMLTWAVPLSACDGGDLGGGILVGERYLGFIGVSRRQVRDGQPAILIDMCSSEGAPDDPDGLIMTIPEAMDLAVTLLRLAIQGKPIRHGDGDEIGGEPGDETGIPLAEAARWLCEMGLTVAEIREMAETEPLFAQMAAALPRDPRHL
jgi:hypothetical protein